MDAIATEEVVVVGYGKQKKESVVSSMSTVGPAQLSVKSANLTNNIAGKLSGLIAVQRSGEPGWDDLYPRYQLVCRWNSPTGTGRRCTP